MSYRRDPVPENKDDLRRFIDNEYRKLEDEDDYTDERLNLAEERLNLAEERLNVLESVIVDLTVSGYGGGTQQANVAFGVTTGWTTIPLDTLRPADQRGVTVNLSNNSISVATESVWRLSYDFSIEGHNSSNSGRVTYIRMYNITDGIASPGEIVVGVGRNQEDTSNSGSFLFDVQPASVNKEIVLQIGGGDAITGGDLIGASLQVNQISELGAFI